MNLLHLKESELEPGFQRDIRGEWLPYLREPDEEMPRYMKEGWAPVDFRFVIRVGTYFWCERVNYKRRGQPIGELQIGCNDFVSRSSVDPEDLKDRQFEEYIEEAKQHAFESWWNRAGYIEYQATWDPTYVGLWYDDRKGRCEAIWDVRANVGTGIDIGMHADEGMAGWIPISEIQKLPEVRTDRVVWPDGSRAVLEDASREILTGLVHYWNDHVNLYNQPG